MNSPHNGKMLLTDLKIKTTRAKTRAFKLTDGESLYLLVKSNGSKLWQFRYSFAERSKTASYGPYPRVSLLEARQRKRDDQSLLRQGIDPNAQRMREKRLQIYQSRNTFRAVAEDWYECNENSWVPSYSEDVWNRLENHILPHLGTRPIVEIQPLELLDTIKLIEAAGTTDITHRIMLCCRAIYDYAILTGRVQHNIAIGLQKGLKRHRKKHHPTLQAEEVGRFLNSFSQFETSAQNRCAFTLLLLTALRTKELRHAKWLDINWREKKWRIPADTSKMRREHLVPLSKQTLAILEELRKHTGDGPWLFPSQCGYRHEVMSENTINHMIHRMGYKGKIVGHGFRALFSTIANEKGNFHPDSIERQLSHVERNQVRAAYNRAEYLEERANLMQWWADWLSKQGLQFSTEKNL